MGEQFFCPECGHVDDAVGECFECGIPLKKPEAAEEQQFDRYDDEFDLTPAEAVEANGDLDDFVTEEADHGFEGGLRVA